MSLIGLHAIYTASSAFLFTGGKIMTNRRFFSAQDLALTLAKSEETKERIMQWQEQDLYDWLEIVGFDFTDQRGWYRYVRDMRNKERHPTAKIAVEQLSLF